MNAELGTFLAIAARTPFVWGKSDCCLWVADWLVTCGHPDPAARIRGRYRSAFGAARILRSGGGLTGVACGMALRLGLDPSESPAAGDVGLVEVETPHGRQLAAGLCVGRRWAVRATTGVLVGEMSPVQAWRV